MVRRPASLRETLTENAPLAGKTPPSDAARLDAPGYAGLEDKSEATGKSLGASNNSLARATNEILSKLIHANATTWAVYAVDPTRGSSLQVSPDLQKYVPRIRRDFASIFREESNALLTIAEKDEPGDIDDVPEDCETVKEESIAEIRRPGSSAARVRQRKAQRPRPKAKYIKPRTQTADLATSKKRPRSASSCESLREPADNADETEEDDEEEAWSRLQIISETKTEKFRVDDSGKMTKFFKHRLELTQQTAMRNILKAWIKAIEPKKQAVYPYCSSKHPDRDPGKVPPWWPPTDQVRHTEPDHLHKPERWQLAVAILRLRRSPNWTDFLKQSTQQIELRYDSDKANGEHRRVFRKKMLADVYRAAKLEEQYMDGGRDGSSQMTFEVVTKDDTVPKKRKQRSSGHQSSKASSSPTSNDGTRSPMSAWKQGEPGSGRQHLLQSHHGLLAYDQHEDETLRIGPIRTTSEASFEQQQPLGGPHGFEYAPTVDYPRYEQPIQNGYHQLPFPGRAPHPAYTDERIMEDLRTENEGVQQGNMSIELRPMADPSKADQSYSSIQNRVIDGRRDLRASVQPQQYGWPSPAMTTSFQSSTAGSPFIQPAKLNFGLPGTPSIPRADTSFTSTTSSFSGPVDYSFSPSSQPAPIHPPPTHSYPCGWTYP